VAREFRLRMKKAFDGKGIDIGIPQQKMYLEDSLFTSSKENFNQTN
jgi:small-conductance mechanosensitive channel